jgi:hypothetical protein
LGRVTIFAKGNLDLKDSLHSLRIGGEVRWNGINEIVRARFPGTLVRLRHETWTRSDALLAADGTVPPEIARRALPLGAHPAEAQFSHALFAAEADAVILSIQPDLAVPLARHRRDGYLFSASEWNQWSPTDQRWFLDTFAATALPAPEETMRNLAEIVARRRQRSDAPILIYNLSAVVPGDRLHCHEGWGEILSTRIRRFNLALIELSRATGISIIDVDAVVARGGAERLKLDTFHLTAEGCRRVALEVVRVLEDLGCLPSPSPAAP